ncbi:MAG: hypothetical protein K2Q01_12540 [Rickettsiales bacterium]|nr:hypothetical protein [Rickettsiales bacterium]
MKDVLQPPESFKQLDIPRKEMPDSRSQYLVYSSKTEFVTVDAENAQAAIAASGVKDPVRVVRHIMMQNNVIEFPSDETMPAEAVQVPAAAEVAVELPQPAGEEASLSEGEVQKLLGEQGA